MKQVAKLSIEGMHCEACVRRVGNALGALPGVEVENVAVGLATVAFDKSMTVEKIVAAVETIGFPARMVG